jgi:hypothetical protein
MPKHTQVSMIVRAFVDQLLVPTVSSGGDRQFPPARFGTAFQIPITGIEST